MFDQNSLGGRKTAFYKIIGMYAFSKKCRIKGSCIVHTQESP